MPVMSVRMSEEELKRIRAAAKAEDKEKSSLARELLMDGLKFKMLLGYRQGKVPLSKLSKALDLNFSETLDFLALFGLESPVSYDDYLQGKETAGKAIH